LTDEQTGLGALVFSIVVSICSLSFGYMADTRVIPRKWIFCFGVLTWTVASCATFFVTNLSGYLATRAFVAVGEGSLVVVPSVCAAFSSLPKSQVISDFYPAAKRGRYLAIYYMAIPFGGAIGLVASAYSAEAFGWQYTFLFVGMPGFCAVMLILFVTEPPFGTFDEPTTQPSLLQALKELALKKVRSIFRFLSLFFELTVLGLLMLCPCQHLSDVCSRWSW
jgi:MFS family permease